LAVVDKKDDIQIKTKMTGTIVGSIWRGSERKIESRYINGKFQLTPEIEQSILYCNNYSIRVYMDTEPTTLKATESQLKALKKFLTVGK
jgi:hypothetical protein